MKVWACLDKDRECPIDMVYFEEEDGTLTFADSTYGEMRSMYSSINTLWENKGEYNDIELICEVFDD